MTDGYSYLHLGEPEDPDRNVVCRYKVSTDLPMDRAAEAIAAEQSTGSIWREADLGLHYGPD